DEHPAQAVRSKPDSSMSVCARLCKERRADGWISAGNSGAIMATALFVQGRIRGVERPALGSIIPTRNGFAYFLDVGANVDSKPEYLVQFAAMGAIYAREMMGRPEPRVGLLSNGEEEGKGDELVREAGRRLKGTMRGFVGNVEPKDLYASKALRSSPAAVLTHGPSRTQSAGRAGRSTIGSSVRFALRWAGDQGERAHARRQHRHGDDQSAGQESRGVLGRADRDAACSARS